MKRTELRRYTLYALYGIYAFLWAGGVHSYVFTDGPPDHLAWAGTLFMTLAAVLVLMHASTAMRLRLLAAGIVGYLVEILGVFTGIPFGGYEYTQAFAPLLFEVPLVMIAAWLVLAAYIAALLGPVLGRGLRGILLTAAALTLIDFVLDPVAAGPMELWRWDAPGVYFGIPWSNFAGWYVTSVVVMAIVLWKAPPVRSAAALHRIGLSIVAFFTAVAFGTGLLLPAAVGLALCVGHGILRFTDSAPTR